MGNRGYAFTQSRVQCDHDNNANIEVTNKTLNALNTHEKDLQVRKINYEKRINEMERRSISVFRDVEFQGEDVKEIVSS